jgi:outer membrane protein OmpA-like peptidoglycan-associated protein/tetratricopeptide (TPR) repeat protein
MKNQRFFLFAFCVLLFNSGFAQYDLSGINKKAIESYNIGLEKAQERKYKEAVEFLQEAIQRDPKYIDAYLSLAGVYGQMKDHQQSINTYEKAFSLDSNYTAEYKLPYSINLAGLGQFHKAFDVIEVLLLKPKLNPNARKSAEYRKKTYQFALDFEKNNPSKFYVFKPVNLGDDINSKESEYFPSIPIQSDKIIYTRRLNNWNEDFFGSVKSGGKWSRATPLPGNINTAQNEGAQNLSQDASWLIFTGCNREGGFGGCDLYISYLTSEGWSEAINLGNKINSDQWDSQPSLSPDKRDLYFSSRRLGGRGGSDLFVSNLGANGRWSDPENLGPQINTSGDESSPFIHADNQTLYFTSNTLPGYGEEDLFLTRKGADGRWGLPQNLGYPINTIHHEGTLFIAADAKTAYYASDRSDTRGGLDIYSFELREDIRPFKTLWVKGKVFDKKTAAGLPSSVELIDLASKQIISKVQTDETGNYLITLPVGKDYAFNVGRRGYLFYSDNFSLKGKSPDSTYKKDIPLQPLEANAIVVLRNIFFDFNKYELINESQIELDRLVQLLNENPTVKIQIEGHTDNIGKAADNLKLSESRARSVVAYLIKKGIASNRLSAKGAGASKPIAPNNTEAGRAQNRRTEVKVISK